MRVESIIIIGGDSNIGRSLATRAEKLGMKVWKTTRRKKENSNNWLYLDLLDEKSVDSFEFPNENISTVFLCAGITSIKECSCNSTLTRIVNVKNTVRIATFFMQKILCPIL